jgi:seryl-tRNA synthetase
MLDIKYIRDHAAAVRANAARRGADSLQIDVALAAYEEQAVLQRRLDPLRQQRNSNATAVKSCRDAGQRQKLIENGQKLKSQLGVWEGEQRLVVARMEEALRAIPNMTHPEVPDGDEGQGRVLHLVGEKPRFDFEPLDHLALATALDLVDFDNGARVSGQKFYYLKNEAVLLEMALIQFALARLAERGYSLYTTPDLARISVLEATGFAPRGPESQVYRVADTDLCLVGTAEITLGGLGLDRDFGAGEMPLRLAGLSHCFRREAGGHGAESRGLYRVHQFSKVEMFAFCAAPDAEALHAEMRDIEIGLFADLGLHFRVVDMAAGDLGAPAYRKFDLEAWMPGRGIFGEITSTSHCTDYQGRRLRGRYRDGTGLQPVHTLNGTGIATARTIAVLLETHQRADGGVDIPPVLRPYMGGMQRIGGRL